jgi:multisubunit Na+/H+ antiporter MnhF subunit
MAKVTILFGLLLIVLGVYGYVGTGWQAPTALIPMYVGIVFTILGFLARRGSQKKRMTVMHIAVTLGLLGFLGTALSIWKFIRMETGHPMVRPIAVEDQAFFSVMMLIYVLLCVRSFIRARRNPPADGGDQQAAS